jgi:hypothetical protein
LRHKQMQCGIKHLSQKAWKKRGKRFWEDNINVEKCESCIEFSWLRIKTIFLLWQGYKFFSSVRAWNVAICMSKKDCTVEVFS